MQLLKALKLHGGVTESNLDEPNIEALSKGLENIEKHLENIKLFGLNSVVALNKFDTDSEEELQFLRNWAKDNNLNYGISEGYSKGGGEGTKDLAKLVEKVAQEPAKFKKLYSNEDESIILRKIVAPIYGAKDVTFYNKLDHLL